MSKEYINENSKLIDKPTGITSTAASTSGSNESKGQPRFKITNITNKTRVVINETVNRVRTFSISSAHSTDNLYGKTSYFMILIYSKAYTEHIQ